MTLKDLDSILPRGTAISPVNLRERVVKDALATWNWNSLKAELDSATLDQTVLLVLLGHVRRTSIMKYPKPAAEVRRDKFFAELEAYVHTKLGSELSILVGKEVSLIRQIEQEYRTILQILDNCAISQLPREVRVAACIVRAGHQYLLIKKQFDDTFQARREITVTSGPLLPAQDGDRLSADGLLATLVNALSATLVMEAHHNHWFDGLEHVVLPALPDVSEDDLYKAGSTELLAICWRGWTRVEERCRFLGGELEICLGANLPKGAPKGATQITIYQPQIYEAFDYAANERLNDRLVQTFIEMYWESDMAAKATGLQENTPLLPHAFVNPTEAHSAVSLSEILSYDIGADQERPGGLRIVEWLRGYSVLKCLVETAGERATKPADILLKISRPRLIDVLVQCGLTDHNASTFVDAVTLSKSSRDLFDCPVIKTEDGLLVFGPAVIHSNPARILLSLLGNLGEPLSRKGKAFESDVLSYLRNRSLGAESFTAKRNGEEYEYDVVLVWGGYIFVFECKNRSLSSSHPGSSYYFAMELRSAAKQVKRLAAALTSHPDILTDHMAVDVTKMKVIPCVLHSLPFSLPGQLDGVYFTDASALKRFFQERYVHFKTAHRVTDKIKLLHRSAVHSLWASDVPTAEDFLRHLDEPFQLTLMVEHFDVRPHPFAIGTNIIVAPEFRRKEMSLESMSEMFGVSANLIRTESAKVTKVVKKLRSSKKATKKARKK